MRRRDFLATGATLALFGSAAARPWRRARIRFGCAAITWGGNDLAAMDDIAALGYRGIQLRGSAFNTWGEFPEELKTLLADRKLEFVALSSGNLALDPAQASQSLKEHYRHARFLKDAGGRYLQILEDRPRGHTPEPDDYVYVGRLLTELGKRTADLGVPLVYHNHIGAFGEKPDELARILDAADPRVVHLLLDTAHYKQAGGDPAAAIRRYGGRIRLLHLKDVDGSHFIELGRGSVDFKAVFAALDDIAFDGWGVVEVDDLADPRANTPKESNAIGRRFLESLGRWNDGS
ncbi:MAG TPA: sugar phosphate isomerase/epimerase [Gemmatimonadales bacterium]|nr:sugar phosphate isomerase/epimerase [Gemmatimonadales bacterium]